jgi:hypothetical protein
MNLQPILDKYEEKCATTSDIYQLLPYIKSYAEQCAHCTEMGVRNPTSTYAFLAANPKRLVSYDIGRYPEVDEAEQLAKDAGIDFEFRLQDVLEADIEETDMLWFDTYHTATQLERELERHAGKAKKFMAFHDVVTYGHIGEINYPGISAELSCGRGLWDALNPFLSSHPEWIQELLLEFNNGLLVLRRIV